LPLSTDTAVHLAALDGTEFNLPAQIVQASFKEQHLFFKDLDAATESAHDAATVERFEEDLEKYGKGHSYRLDDALTIGI
jgi:hypothetical protein